MARPSIRDGVEARSKKPFEVAIDERCGRLDVQEMASEFGFRLEPFKRALRAEGYRIITTPALREREADRS